MSNSASDPRPILGFATQGAGGDDESRLIDLLSHLPVEIFPFQRGQKAASARQLLRIASKRHHSLIVMEGTGVAGGAAILLAKWLHRTPYVVSSGDAVAPFLAGRWPIAAPIFSLYERLLYRNCSGFIGWTPYLVGRALTWGAPRAMTAAGWAPHERAGEARDGVRRSLGIPVLPRAAAASAPRASHSDTRSE